MLDSPKKIIQRRAVSMPGLERETDILEASKRNSSQINCTLDSGIVSPLNVVDVPNLDACNLNTSSSVITTQEANKGRNYIIIKLKKLQKYTY